MILPCRVFPASATRRVSGKNHLLDLSAHVVTSRLTDGFEERGPFRWLWLWGRFASPAHSAIVEVRSRIAAELAARAHRSFSRARASRPASVRVKRNGRQLPIGRAIRATSPRSVIRRITSGRSPSTCGSPRTWKKSLTSPSATALNARTCAAVSPCRVEPVTTMPLSLEDGGEHACESSDADASAHARRPPASSPFLKAMTLWIPLNPHINGVEIDGVQDCYGQRLRDRCGERSRPLAGHYPNTPS